MSITIKLKDHDPELKALPCPFCGATELWCSKHIGEGRILRIECAICGAKGPRDFGKALEKWNTRDIYVQDFFREWL